MTKNKIKQDKTAELVKYHDLVTATLDYLIDSNEFRIKTEDFDSEVHYRKLKVQTKEHFEKGRLSRLKQWFHDLTEAQRETADFKFNAYLKAKTGQDVNIFKDYFDRVDKVIAKGKISTDNQFYDVNSMVDQLSHAVPVDFDRVTMLNKLLADYEQRKAKNRSKN